MTGPLQDEHPGGVYAAPLDLSSLRARCAGPLDLWRTLDLSRIDDKETLLNALAQALEFPADFGRNWDALADSVQDLGWLRWSCLVLELRNADRIKAAAGGDWNIALDILRDAATYWETRGKRLVVVVHGTDGLPPPGA